MPDIYKAPHKKTHKSTKAKPEILTKFAPTKNPLSSFCVTPQNLSFDVQHSEEQILLFLRQHFIVNTGWIVLSVFLFFLPSFFNLFSIFSFLSPSFQFVIQVVWYFLVTGYVLERFIVWYYNVYIVTNERLVDVDFYSLLFKRVSEVKFGHIEDLTAASGGVVQSLFNYGDIMIQTAAEVPEIEFEKVPNPEVVVKLISELNSSEEDKNK